MDSTVLIPARAGFGREDRINASIAIFQRSRCAILEGKVFTLEGETQAVRVASGMPVHSAIACAHLGQPKRFCSHAPPRWPRPCMLAVEEAPHSLLVSWE